MIEFIGVGVSMIVSLIAFLFGVRVYHLSHNHDAKESLRIKSDAFAEKLRSRLYE